MGETELCERCVEVEVSDPTLFLSNSGTGYSSLWILQPAVPSGTSDTTTSVTFPKNQTGYMKIVPGTSNTTILSSLPTTFDGRGWRTKNPLSGTIYSGTWIIYLTITTGKYVTGNIYVYARIWKSPNPDGSNAVAITDWFQVALITSPSASTTYNVSGSISLGDIQFNNEYLFVEFALGTTSACTFATGCVVTFVCNTYRQRIETPNASLSGLYDVEGVATVSSDTLAITITEVITYPVELIANQFPMIYILKPEVAKELVSKVKNVVVIHVANDFPEYLIKSGKASELRSKWS